MKPHHYCLHRSNYWLLATLCFVSQGMVLGVQNSVVVWGSGPVASVPADVTNVASVVTAYSYCIATMRDGRLRKWGAGSADIPPTATNATIASATGNSFVVLRRDGLVVDQQGDFRATNAVAVVVAEQYGAGAVRSDGVFTAWGGLWSPASNTTNVVAVAKGGYATLRVLFADGTLGPVPSGLSVTPSNIVAMADGNYAVFLKADGTLISSSSQSNILSTLSNVVAVASGYAHGLALRSDGTVAVWGSNSAGQTNVPAGLSNVVAISAGDYHSLALKSDGTVLAWGSNSSGQTNVPAGLTSVAAIFAGPGYSVAIVGGSPPALLSQPPDEIVWAGQPATFTVKAVGSSPLRFQWQFNGEIIEGATNSFYRLASAERANSGIYNVVVSNARGTAVSREAYLLVKTNVAITAQPTSKITWFGSSVTLRFGVEGPWPLSYQWYFNGSPVSDATNATLLVANTSLVNAGDYWAVVSYPYGVVTSLVARLSVAAVGAWGSPPWATSVPTNLQSIAAISACDSYSLFLKPDGTVAASGYNYYGTTEVPTDLSNVVAVAAGSHHSLALRADGTLVSWGTNDYGQLNIPPDAINVLGISAGAVHSLALRADGVVVAWGDQRYGQIQVPPGLTNVVSIAAGEYSSLALRADGTVVAWGFPAGLLTGTGIPDSLSNIVGIAAGGTHWLALRDNGTVVTWGSDYYGQQSTFPQNLSNVVAIAAGHDHSLALRNDGTVVAWGNNNVSQASVPSGLSNVVAIAAGYAHSLGLVAGGLYAPSVPPLIPARNQGTFAVQVPTLRGKSYYLQHRDALSASQWMLHPPVPGDGTPQALVDPNATVSQRFYRVWQKP